MQKVFFHFKNHYYATLDSHISGGSHHSSHFWFYRNSCRCSFHCQNSVFHFYNIIPDLIGCRWLPAGRLALNINQPVNMPAGKNNSPEGSIDCSSGLLFCYSLLLKETLRLMSLNKYLHLKG